MNATAHTPCPWTAIGDEVYGADGSRVAEAVASRDKALVVAAPTMLVALKAARDCILIDRQALADAHMNPATNQLDEDGQAGVDEYDEVLGQIDEAIKAAEGSAA